MCLVLEFCPIKNLTLGGGGGGGGSFYSDSGENNTVAKLS